MCLVCPTIEINVCSAYLQNVLVRFFLLLRKHCGSENTALLCKGSVEIVAANVPGEIVCDFLQAHQRLRVLNVTIQTPGWIMEESAYINYEDPRDDVKELFPKSGILEGDKQRMLEFIETRDEAKIAYNVFVEHPGIREILQKKTLSQIDKMWVQVLPIMSQYLKNIEHVVSL